MLFCFMLCFFLFALSSCSILFVLLTFDGDLFPCHAYYSLCFYHVVLFSYCTFFCCIFPSCAPRYTFYSLLFLHSKLFPRCTFFSCCGFFMSQLFQFLIFLSLLISFPVALFSYSPFLCCTFSMLHF